MEEINESLIKIHVELGEINKALEAARRNNRQLCSEEWLNAVKNSLNNCDQTLIAIASLSDLDKSLFYDSLLHCFDAQSIIYISEKTDHRIKFKDLEYIFKQHLKCRIHNASRDINFRAMMDLADYALRTYIDTESTIESNRHGKIQNFSFKYNLWKEIRNIALDENRTEDFITASERLKEPITRDEAIILISAHLDCIKIKLMEKRLGGISNDSTSDIRVQDLKVYKQISKLLPYLTEEENIIFRTALFE